ncbi:MAG: hypothetical protein V4463_23505 [Pseudomonadota bacterium]
MTARHALYIFLAGCAIIGGVGEYFDQHRIAEPVAWTFSSEVALLFPIFMWYHLDSEARGYARSRWLSAGVIGLSIVAIPYYLVRSRPHGQRVRALCYCVAFLVAAMVAMLGGGMVVALFA